MMQTLIRKNRYTHCYKGFVIHYRPKTAAHRVARYEVFCGDQSFGLFDGKAQAIHYIDQLYKMQHLCTAEKATPA
ncbi:hypothetical protein SODG_002746 [Sodalis praecaptivus]|uniref:hypothetical protein n=1 Tax=Sodalis praecaptivus TaxID=1239307 RepID=UPI0027EE00E4|nr:hypothetical protein [Sodalis praecaptivus]CAJ0995248.1 hypothetical protein NVIRENTERO_01820 [Sodalis praecaptivus]